MPLSARPPVARPPGPRPALPAGLLCTLVFSAAAAPAPGAPPLPGTGAAGLQGPRPAAWASDAPPGLGPLPGAEALGDAAPQAEAHGSLTGAAAFLLVLVPMLYIVIKPLLPRCRSGVDPGVVVVARPQERPPQDAGRVAGIGMSDTVLVASIEHDFLYDLDAEKPMRAKASAGGLGKVAGQLQRIHPTNLVSVHPVYVWQGVGKQEQVYGFGFEQPCAGLSEEQRRKFEEEKARRAGWVEDEPLRFKVDRRPQTVRVFRRTVEPAATPPPGLPTEGPRVTYLLLDHPWFRQREEIYPDQPGSTKTLKFFSLWNQAVGALIAREEPRVYQCPDYHTALAPWYALRACGKSRPPPRVALVLHNAEYQGAISSQQLVKYQFKRLKDILNLPEKLIRDRMMSEGGFNILQAIVQYMLLTQGGHGVCAVSKTYAQESQIKHRALWSLPEVVGLDNPMLENERPPQHPDGLAFPERRRLAKEALYAHDDFRPKDEGEEDKGYGFLRNDPDARIFVFLGRWVKQKGMDYIADIAEWMVATYPNLQMVIMGPPFDSFGSYAELKLKYVATHPNYLGRLKVLPLFYNINAVHPDAKFAFDFCLMPSRDEPFGYVDIEFAWFGALTVGAITGGLGKVPGIYYIPSNVNSAAHICHLFKGCIKKAMELSTAQLLRIGQFAIDTVFPVEQWQAELLRLYKTAEDKGKLTSSNYSPLSRHPDVQALMDDPHNNHLVLPSRLCTGHGLGPPAPQPAEPGSPPHGPGALPPPLPPGPVDPVGGIGPLEEDLLPALDAELGGEERDFIRAEVTDEQIKDRVAQLVEQSRTAKGSGCCGRTLYAQDVLAVTQWEAMKDGEFKDRPQALGKLRSDFALRDLRTGDAGAGGFRDWCVRLGGCLGTCCGERCREPLCNLLPCLTKRLTKFLAAETLGVKRIDLAIIVHFLTTPFLQEVCVAQLRLDQLKPETSRWTELAGLLAQPFALIFWTKLTIRFHPNRVMALAVLLRLPALLLPSWYRLNLKEEGSSQTTFVCTLAYWWLGVLAGADQLFIFYNFMGAAVGDISKLALRMGACSGLLFATTGYGSLAIRHFAKSEHRIGGLAPIVVLGLIFDIVLIVCYVCAPAPYREFRLPELNLKTTRIIFRHRRSLKFLAVSIVFSAVTSASVSGAAVMRWRSLEPFVSHKLLGLSPDIAYARVMPAVMALAVLTWSFLIHKLPNHASNMVEATTFLLPPAALIQCAVVLTVGDAVQYASAVDALFILTLLLDVVQSTSVFIAVLTVVGSRWNFMNFLTVALFLRGLVAFGVMLLGDVDAVRGIREQTSQAFARHWMPAITAVAVLQWLLSVGGMRFYNKESQALLTDAKKRIQSNNNRGLKEHLASLA